MRTTTTIANWIIRVTAIVQLTLGALFWTGHAYTYVPVHMVVGSALVLALWTVAVVALVARVRRGLAAFELVWGLALAGFGMRQAHYLIGPMHWIVRVVHLLMALSAMGIAGVLAKVVLATAPERDRPEEVERGSAAVRRVS